MINRRLADTRAMLDTWEIEGKTPADRIKSFIHILIANRAEAELSYLKAAGDELGAALLDMRFMLASALVGAKRAAEAAALYRSALDLARQVRSTSALDRTIAVASNNIGWELYETLSRTAHGDALMQCCAETSLTYWLRCGDWINEERALYLKALVSIATGSPQSGLDDANKALAVITSHGERPLDAALLDHIGPMARSAADAGAILGVIAGRDSNDPTTSLDQRKCGICQFFRCLRQCNDSWKGPRCPSHTVCRKGR